MGDVGHKKLAFLPVARRADSDRLLQRKNVGRRKQPVMIVTYTQTAGEERASVDAHFELTILDSDEIGCLRDCLRDVLYAPMRRVIPCEVVPIVELKSAG